MRTLIDFAIREEYSRVKALGDDLSDINSLINWDRFRFLEPLIYKNKTSRGGRPNIDIVIMVKGACAPGVGLVYQTQNWSAKLRTESRFRIFLGTTEVIPDFKHCLAIFGSGDRMRQIRGYLERASDAALMRKGLS